MSDRKQGKRLSQLLNQGILSIMGVIFCVLAFTKANSEQARMLMLVIGVLLILMGVVRVWLISRLFRAVDDNGFDEAQKQHKE